MKKVNGERLRGGGGGFGATKRALKEVFRRAPEDLLDENLLEPTSPRTASPTAGHPQFEPVGRGGGVEEGSQATLSQPTADEHTKKKKEAASAGDPQPCQQQRLRMRMPRSPLPGDHRHPSPSL